MWIQLVSNPGFMRVCYGTHQIDLSVQLFCLDIPDTFYSTFISLILYLSRQQKFVSDEQRHRYIMCDTLCMNTIKATTWFENHRLAVSAYLEVKKPACMPEN